MKSMKTGLTAVALALSFVGAAQAAPSFAAGGGSVFFNNFENLYRTAANCGVVGGCLAAVAGDPAGFRRINPLLANNVIIGDVFVGILNVQNIDSNATGSDTYNSNPGNRFTGYFAQEVKSFGPLEGLVGHINLGTTVDPFGILAAGEMFRFYSDVASFSSGGSGFNVTANIAAATSGTFWGSMGFVDGSGDGYAYTHTNLLTTVVDSNTENFSALNMMLKGPGYNAGELLKLNDFNESEIGGTIGSPASQLCSLADIANPLVSCTDFTGTSEIEVNNRFGSTSPWMFASNDPFEFNRIPEPGSLALLGLALAGMGFMRRKSA